MDTAAQWPPQDIVVKPMEEIVTGPTTTKAANSGERKVRPQKEQALNCPRCNSTNTKFCYYNNYSLSQPRYFCKTCRRYWTEGGSLRNIPVGGGSRKNKRSSSSSSSSSSTTNNSSNSKKLPDLVPPPFSHQNPSKILDTQDLNLGLISIHNPHHDFKAITEMIQVPNFENSNNKLDLQNPSSVSSSLELLTGIGATTRGLSSFMAAAAPPPPPLVTTGGDPGAVYNSSGFASLVDFKPSLSFSLDGLGSNYGSFQGPNGKLLFPFEDLKSSNANGGEESRDQHGDSTGYWNGVIGGGSW